MMISGDICPDQSEASVGDRWPMRGLDSGWDILTPEGNLTRRELTSPRLHTEIRTAADPGQGKMTPLIPQLISENSHFLLRKNGMKQPRDDSRYNSILRQLNGSSLKLSYELMSKTYWGPNPKKIYNYLCHSKVCLDHSRKQFILIKLQSLAR